MKNRFFNSTAVSLGVIAIAVLWAYWPVLTSMQNAWSIDPQYSHGYLVPLFSLFLLWWRSDRFSIKDMKPSWWGIPIILFALSGWTIGSHYSILSTEPLSLIPLVAGITVSFGGWKALRWAWPSIGFLVFMIPLHPRISVFFSGPLQRFATLSSTWLLQAVGIPAQADQNVILLTEVEMGIIEACSGLRMMFVFLALSTAAVLLIERPWLEKVLILLSAIPIAVTCNVIRITMTGILHETSGPKFANAVFHDLGGWIMMLMGVGLLWLELKLLGKIIVYETEEIPESELIRS